MLKLAALLLLLSRFAAASTTLYFTNSAISGGTSFSIETGAGTWTYVSEYTDKMDLSATKTGSISAGTRIGAMTSAIINIGLDRQYYHQTPLAAQTFSGTVLLQCMGREYNGGDDIAAGCVSIRSCRADASACTTLVALTCIGGTVAEWINNASHRNVNVLNSVAISGTSTAGDILVANIGGTNLVTGATPEFSYKYGGTDTDCPVNDTTTSDCACRITFSNDVIFVAGSYHRMMMGVGQ